MDKIIAGIAASIFIFPIWFAKAAQTISTANKGIASLMIMGVAMLSVAAARGIDWLSK